MVKNGTPDGRHRSFSMRLTIAMELAYSWRYLDANISRVNDNKLLEGADMVYFFSDYLSHSTYGRFVKLVRANRIPFGYIHTVNVESLVRQVFEDLVIKVSN